jgi:microcystin-dependent protein
VALTTSQLPAHDHGLQTITPTGEGAAHDNRGPRLALNYCIAITGIFPDRS